MHCTYIYRPLYQFSTNYVFLSFFLIRNTKRVFFSDSFFVATVDLFDKCENRIQYLEHVQLSVTASYSIRGHIEVQLTSPSGTTSKLLEPRHNDIQKMNLKDWSFLSLQFWGENPVGIWTVKISDQVIQNSYFL